MKPLDLSRGGSLPWTNVYGLARSALAFGTLLTLLFNDTTLLFRPAGGELTGNFGREGMFGWSLFFLVPPESLELARWVSVLVLLIVISGWRPRITGILHWWITFSLPASAVLVDGGDHIAAVLTLLLIPVTLTDGRKWHWSPPEEGRRGVASLIAGQIAFSAFLVIRLQVALVYFHAGVGKMRVEEWSDGTALYYWFTHSAFGASPWLEPFLLPLLASPIIVTSLTWGVIIFELALFLGLAMEKRWWPYLLVLGIFFHLGIIVVHGLVSFFFSMAGALILYLRPIERPFGFPAWVLRLRPQLDWIGSIGGRRARVPAPIVP